MASSRPSSKSKSKSSSAEALKADYSRRSGLVFLLAVIMILYTRMYGLGIAELGGSKAFSTTSFTTFVQNFFSKVIGPAGFTSLFVLLGMDLELKRKRGISLSIQHRALRYLLPFFSWNILVLITVVLAEAMGAGASQFMPAVVPETFEGMVNAVVGYRSDTIVAQLWYAREAFLLLLIAPLLRPMVKSKELAYALLLPLFICVPLLVIHPFFARLLSSLFFFFFGMATVNLSQLSRFMRKRSKYGVVVFVVLAVVCTYKNTFLRLDYAGGLLTTGTQLLGFWALWWIAGQLRSLRVYDRVERFTVRHGFFLLAGFYPLLAVWRKMVTVWLLPLPLPALFWYLVAPIMLAAVVLAIAHTLWAKVKVVYYVASGGREL